MEDGNELAVVKGSLLLRVLSVLSVEGVGESEAAESGDEGVEGQEGDKRLRLAVGLEVGVEGREGVANSHCFLIKLITMDTQVVFSD